MKIIALLLAGWFLLCTFQLNAQHGCTDPSALNYDPEAEINNGSCRYPDSRLHPQKKSSLDNRLLECSGIVKSGEDYWAHNDSGNPNALYKVDIETGEVLHQVYIRNIPNTDWEDLAVDDTYIYVGDFGNNKGNRKDLRIGKIPLEMLANDTANATIISFSYADQYSYELEKQNHDFDMEAMISYGDSLYLFSKNWLNGKTRLYPCSKRPGSYVLHSVDSLDVLGQLTAADVSEDKRKIALLGYTREGKVWMFTLFDFPNSDFFRGNKRRFELGNALKLGQAEAICFENAENLLIGSEKFAIVPQRLLHLSWPVQPEVVNRKFQFPDFFSIRYGDTGKANIIFFGKKLPIEKIEIRNLGGETIWTQNFKTKLDKFYLPFEKNLYPGLVHIFIGRNVYIKKL